MLFAFVCSFDLLLLLFCVLLRLAIPSSLSVWVHLSVFSLTMMWTTIRPMKARTLQRQRQSSSQLESKARIMAIASDRIDFAMAESKHCRIDGLDLPHQ